MMVKVCSGVYDQLSVGGACEGRVSREQLPQRAKRGVHC